MTDADRIASEKDLERLRTMAMSLLRENERLMARLGELYKQVAEAKGEAAAQLRLEIAALEKELNVQLPAATLQPDDFDTIDYTVETVMRVAR